MTLDKRTRERLLAHCGQLEEDDGVDPREYFSSGKLQYKQNRKALQLCQQVAHTLGLVLAGEFADERLQSLRVVSVVPAPNSQQLAVTCCTDWPCDSAQTAEILECLAAVSGRLRSEVAAAVSRRRAPKLLFRVVGSAET